MNILSFERRVDVIARLVEGSSYRAVERLTGIHHDTSIRLALRAGDSCARLHDRRVRDLQAKHVQVDEQWTFVQKKQARCADNAPPDIGDAWVFVSLDADTKLVLNWLVEKRTLEAATTCLLDLRERVVGRPQITTDGFAPYVEAIEVAFGADVDYAMTIHKDADAKGNT